MSVYYPHDDRHEADDLRSTIAELEQRNGQLVVDLMRMSALASELQEKLTRWESELQILKQQKGHNLCWVGIPKLLKNTIGLANGLGIAEVYPDTQGVTREEFQVGCRVFQDDLFGPIEK